MADLVSIGVSGLTAYQNALSVTGNNIANVNTPGYTEEQAVLAPAGLSGNDVISIGGGVLTQSINRLSNSFLESNLRDATAAVGAQNSLVQGLSQLQNEIGSSTAGLSTQLQSFFNSVSSLQANPSDAGTRANFFASAQSTAEQFNSVGATLQTLSSDTVTQINNSTDTVNGILKQIYSVNQEINLHASDTNPPASLLDQRDELLTQLSQNMGISSQYSTTGAVTVYAGSSATGPALVNSTTVNNISAQVDPNNQSTINFVLNQKSSPQPIPQITSGVIGGYVNFMSQGIAPTVDQINRIANTFGSAINNIQTNGMDATGQVGQPMFYLGPQYVAQGPAIAGSENLSVTMSDPTQVTGNGYTAVYDGNTSQWTVTDTATGASQSGSNQINLEGLNFNFTGNAVNGDTYTINPTSTAAQSISLAITDPSQIATASQVQVSADLTDNLGTATATATVIPTPAPPVGIKDLSQVISYAANGSGASTYIAPSATNKTIAYIPAGTQNINLNSSGSGSFAIFTRDGVQLSGPAVTDTSFMTTANGFNAGAAQNYSTSYLNQTGGSNSNSYLNQIYSFGQTAAPVQKLDLNGTPIPGSYSPATISTGPIVPGAVIKANSININGQTFPPSDYTVSTSTDLAQQLKQVAGINAIAVGNTVQITENVSAQSTTASAYNITINGNSFTAPTVPALIASINQYAGLGVTATQAVNNGPLTLSSVNPIQVGSNNLGLAEGLAETQNSQNVISETANTTQYSVQIDGTNITASTDTGLIAAVNSNSSLQALGVVASINGQGAISIGRQLTVSINGNTYSAANATDLASTINTSGSNTGLTATVNGDGSISFNSANAPLVIGSNNLNMTAGTTAANTSITGNIWQNITLNGTQYVGSTVSDLANSINAQTATTGVSASINSDGQLAILNSSPNTYSIGANTLGLSSSISPSATVTGTPVTTDQISIGSNNLGISPSTAYGFSANNYYLTVNGFRFSAPTQQGLEANINNSGQGLVASDSSNGLTLSKSDPTGSLVSFNIGSNNLNITPTTTSAPQSLNISLNGEDSDSAALTNLGLSPGFQMSQPLAEDLLVVSVNNTSGMTMQGSYQLPTGSSNGTNAASNTTDTASLAQSKRNWQIKFSTDGTHYQISDTTQSPPTVVVSNGTYSQTNPVIQYGNWSVTFTGAPKPGDTFYVNPTRAPNAPASTFNGQQSEASSLSDNQNIALMAAVATNQSYFGNNLTLQQSYTSVVNDIGAKLSQAQTAQTTQQAVLTQAQSARDDVSGVNLDTELANLLKYQQAYQASSKIVSTAMQLFDYLIQEL